MLLLPIAAHTKYGREMNISSTGWSTSLLSHEEPRLTSYGCARSLRDFFLNRSWLAVATEASSHPSGLEALYAQPWVWGGGGLGNIDECSLQTCLAGAGLRRDSLTFASVCVIPECSATDLAAGDFVETVTRQSLNSADDALAQDYVTLLDRITELNKFLQTGWICGEFQVPWSWFPFGLPFISLTILLLGSCFYATTRKHKNRNAQEDVYPEETIPLHQQDSEDSIQMGKQRKRSDRVWSAFDLVEHTKHLMDRKSETTSILDGIRVGSIFWIMLGHVMAIVSSSGGGYLNPSNFLPPDGLTNTAIGQLLFSSRLAVDGFLCISGFLVVYVLCKKMPYDGSTSPLGRYGESILKLVFARAMRILPLYTFCLGFYTQIAPHLGSGPFWYQWLGLLKPCHDYGWTNFLFLNNFVPWDLGITETCFYHSWYLAVDMQLFLLAPLLVFVYQKNQKRGRQATLALYLCSVIVTCYLAWVRQWSANTFDGASIARYDVEAYAKPHVRASSYLSGMYVAMLLSKKNSRTPWNRIHHAIVTLAIFVMGFITFCTAMGAYSRRACQYGELPEFDECGSTWSRGITFLYTSLSRPVWTAGLGAIMYVCIGRPASGNIVASVLSWRCWIPLSKLAFGVYLIHPIVIFVWQLGNREKQVFELTTFVMTYISVCVVSYVAALLAFLCIELPFASLWNISTTQALSSGRVSPNSVADETSSQYGST